MSRITVEIVIARPRHDVWEELRHLERHVAWMSDAQRIDFHSPQHEGVGTSFDCLTAIGPFHTKDVMTVTRWEEDTVMGVSHHGMFSGRGEFRLRDDLGATRVTWHEELSFPWWFAGPVGEVLARPLLRHVWQKNLTNLATLLTATS